MLGLPATEMFNELDKKNLIKTYHPKFMTIRHYHGRQLTDITKNFTGKFTVIQEL